MTTRSQSPTARSRPAVSVIVPSHQRRESLLRLCAALGKQSTPASTFEVVVAIDGSTDGSAEALAGLTPPYSLHVVVQENRGRAAAVNAAISGASGALLILLDDDMEPSHRFVESHLRAHEGHGRCGVIGAVPMAVDRHMSAASRYVAEKFNRHLSNLAKLGRPGRLTDFYSGNFSLRRELMIELGGFEESFREYGNEDLELAYRMSRSGVEIVFDVDAWALQHNDKSFSALARDSIAEGRTAVHFARLHPDVFDQLKLATYSSGPRLLRAIRDGALALARRWPGFPARLERVEALLSRAEPPGISTFHRLALGYYFWHGVDSELRRAAGAGSLNARLEGLAAELGR